MFSRKFSPLGPSWKNHCWVKVAGLSLALLVVAALVAPHFLSTDRYRGAISNLLAEQTGHCVALGKIHAHLLPRVGFSVEGLRMANPPGFAPGEFITALEVRGSLAFWPLVLHRRLRLAAVELLGAKIQLFEDPNGRTNYTSSPASTASSLFGDPPRLSRSSAPSRSSDTSAIDAPSLQVSDLTLKNVAVIYGSVDGRGQRTAKIDASGVTVELHNVSLAPFRVRQWQANATLSDARVDLAGLNTPIFFRSGSATLRKDVLESRFTAQIGNANQITGTVFVPDVEHAVPKFDLRADDLDLSALLAQRTPARSAKLPAKQAPPSGIFVLLASFRNVPAIARSLDWDSPAGQTDLPLRGPNGLANTTPDSGASSDELLAEGHIAAGKVHDGVYRTGSASAEFRLYADRLEIWPATIRLYGGSLQVSVRTDRRQSPLRYSANLQGRDLNVEQIVGSWPALRGQLAGTGEFDVQIFGSLDSSWGKSLGGSGQFEIRNGRIRGFNLAGAAQSFANLAGLSGNTPFTAIIGDADIRDQRISSRYIHLDSPRGTVDLRGSTGLNGSLDYQGQLSVQIGGMLGSLLTPKGDKVTMPFVLRGSVQHPQIGPARASRGFPPASGNQQTCCSFPNAFQR